MRKHTAEQVNGFLEDYYFGNEENPRGKRTHFETMKCGILSLRNTIFCSKDIEAREDLKELNWMAKQLTDGVVPDPARITE
ncbi:hypothetical protein LTSEWAN_0793 [Salmonella enterica subsp. enterica serovar Wandsworth str. A4-580]|uniref:Uncharacterized protein n=1 Tax=Salmonella enterica subsp. enterica serovar Wandsworth str. A4-580 TaxID=913086 RepID=G5S7J3_SALET|nr:hypothetical protein LTSEWAN_0793 [Salmonella enterica subsp. enterica serovar Wandsworth str. A4-580]EJS8539397.1 hypothetical protein [Salmonella enterica]EJS8565748.1 hypothetical protein [Salmonella enterica]EJS8570601.1 hypothetical protein [Salmonella enterica]